MATQEFPLLPATAQEMTITLGTKEYTVRFAWCATPEGGWFMDMYDLALEPMIRGLPLVAGVNVLQQFDYLQIPGEIRVQVDEDTLIEPTFENFGTTGKVVFITS